MMSFLTQMAVDLLRAAGVPVAGRKRVATFITAVSKWCWQGVTLTWVETNGQSAVLVSRDGVPFGLTIDASVQGIYEIMWFLRPSKPAAISTLGRRMTGWTGSGLAPPKTVIPLTTRCIGDQKLRTHKE